VKIFKTLFNLAKLPLVVAADAITAIPDSAGLDPLFERTRKVCDKIDDAIAEEP
jgi:hypothetical protein